MYIYDDYIRGESLHIFSEVMIPNFETRSFLGILLALVMALANVKTKKNNS